MKPLLHSSRLATLAASLLLLVDARVALAKPEFGPMINAFCAASGGEPPQPWNGDCAFCHAPGTFDKLPEHRVQPNWDQFVLGKQTGDFSFFCPVVPEMNDPPVLDPIGDRTVNAGQELVLPISATDPNGDALLFDAADLPTGASFVDHGDGSAEFRWAPAVTQAGNHPVTFLVRDDWVPPATDSEAITISVGVANRPPVLDPIGDQSVGEGEVLSLTITASDPDADPLLLAAANLPMGASFTDHSDGTARFEWIPAAGQTGSYAVTFSVTDDAAPGASDSEQITISVGGANRPPILDPIGSRTIADGELLAFTISASDPDGDAVSFEAQGVPSGASFTDHADGSAELVWTPDPGTSGSFAVSVVVWDAGEPPASDSEEFTITVGDVNRPPALAPIGNRSLAEGETLTLLVTASDPDGDALSFSMDGLPDGASFMDRGDGTADLSWIPAPEQSGAHALTCRVTDAGAPPASDAEEFVVQLVADGEPPGLSVAKATWHPRSHRLRVKGGGAPSKAVVDVVDADSGIVLWSKRAGGSGGFGSSAKTFIAPCAIRVRVGEMVSEPVEVAGAPATCGPNGDVYTRVKKAGWRHEGREPSRDLEQLEAADGPVVRDESDEERPSVLAIDGNRAPAHGSVQIRDADGGALLGTTQADRAGRFRYREEVASPPCRVQLGVMIDGVEKLLDPVAVRGAEEECGE